MKEAVPQIKTWLSEFTGILHMEKGWYGMMDNLNTFLDIWQPFLVHLAKYDTDPHQ